MKAILAKKIGMTRIFTDTGKQIPVTLLSVGPCAVVQKKDVAKDGYRAIQIGYEDAKESRCNKPRLGHFKKNNVPPKRILKEIRVDDIENYHLGQEIRASIFKPNEFVDVTGISIGKGFQGVVKRHNFSGLKASHGARWKRHMGSAGAGTNPGRIIKGKKMPGRMGGVQTTVQNLKVIEVRDDQNLIFVAGPVPGKRNNILCVRSAVKKTKPK